MAETCGILSVMRRARFLTSILTITLASSCATTELGTTPKDGWALLDNACSIGANVHSVKGSVWLKAHSADGSGQFPAMVDARAPDTLTLEATNLLGATQAVISVMGQKYRITQGSSTQEGRDSWSGIPLRWATDLFIGRIPCPTSAAIKAGARLSVADSALTVDIPSTSERFIYHYRNWGGKPWPEALHWERKGGLAPVDFKFDDPEDPSGSPRKWEAKSGEGEVKARWRDRTLGP